VDSLVVIIPHLGMDGFYQLAEVVELCWFAKLELPLIIEGFLKAVFPGAGLLALAGLDAHVGKKKIILARSHIHYLGLNGRSSALCPFVQRHRGRPG